MSTFSVYMTGGVVYVCPKMLSIALKERIGRVIRLEDRWAA